MKAIYRGYDIEHVIDGKGKLSWRVSKDNKVHCWQNSEEACLKWIDLAKRS